MAAYTRERERERERESIFFPFKGVVLGGFSRCKRSMKYKSDAPNVTFVVRYMLPAKGKGNTSRKRFILQLA